MAYGPGIVQKLRAKFTQMSNAATESAHISPHSKRKRFPSVDDILSESERKRDARLRFENVQCDNLNAREAQSADAFFVKSAEVGVLGELTKNVLNVELKPRSEDISKKVSRPQMLIDESTNEKPKTIAALVSRRIRSSHSAGPYVSDTEEPEFIRVQRSLRRSGSRDEMLADTTPASGSYRRRILFPIQNEQSLVEEQKQMASSLPQLKSSARVLVESRETEQTNALSPPLPVRVSQLISSRDKDSVHNKEYDEQQPTPLKSAYDHRPSDFIHGPMNRSVERRDSSSENLDLMLLSPDAQLYPFDTTISGQLAVMNEAQTSALANTWLALQTVK
ncbi:unnamed protein product [Toxocara canis]|uniref:Uncharacterized protein n=1 Tax=Toxocara canis TaxID=6265 RepID=A0A183UFB6_TOXCA|nr:unnamed protein product [Toxocara canis]